MDFLVELTDKAQLPAARVHRGGYIAVQQGSTLYFRIPNSPWLHDLSYGVRIMHSHGRKQALIKPLFLFIYLII